MFAGLKRKLEQLENSKSSATSVITSQPSSNEPPSSQAKDQPFAQYLSKQQWGKLHPHQQEAVKFLMNRLTASTRTGAILADDMGTGKTCTAIFTSWILARSMQCKGLILCPTGLINNWYSELQRWFPESLGRTAIVLSAINQSKSAKSLDLQVNRFVTSHAVEHPLLVLSYDQFRIYAQALNTIPSLEFVFCDEGHRIKGLDSKISLALNGCSAIRRVVMTGTPVQNNLQELFALVNFVAPGVLGDDVVAFRERYEGVGQQELQAKVQSLMLRRTKEQVLAKILPARHIRYLFVNFDYDASSIVDESGGATEEGGSGTNRQANVYRECCDGARDKAAQQQQSSSSTPALLPIFMKARMICSYGAGAAISSDSVSATLMTSVSSSSSASISSVQDRATLLLAQSAKLRALRNLLLHLRRSRPQEKVIIASAFLDTLDAVKTMVSSEKFSSLRIDGSVSTDARHKILKLFNSTTMTSNNEPLFSILLLATKAGGEGLNLVAANHLVMMDIDWNPAVDAQTMGRIWRPGQTKEIYIYRMIIPNTIEESILRRQLQKVRASSLAINCRSFRLFLCNQPSFFGVGAL